MDTRTGKIYHEPHLILGDIPLREVSAADYLPTRGQGAIIIESDRHHGGEEKGPQLTPLSAEEYALVQQFPDENRPTELALARFVKQRKLLGGKVTPEVKTGFRLGYQACLKDQGIRS